MKSMKDILFVANLQVYSVPYAALYVDLRRKRLLLLVRVSDPGLQTVNYIVTDITQQQLEGYLNKQIGLLDLYASSSYQLATIDGDCISFTSEHDRTFHLSEEFVASNVFDSEYFYDKLRVMSFIKKMNNNQIF